MEIPLAENNPDPIRSAAEARQDLLVKILGSDLAVEISAEFHAGLSGGGDVAAATGRVLGRFQSALTSAQEGPVVLVALAALQLREGRLSGVIRDAAIDLIETGEALAAYRPADFSQRKAVGAMLEEFRLLLSEALVQLE